MRKQIEDLRKQADAEFARAANKPLSVKARQDLAALEEAVAQAIVRGIPRHPLTAEHRAQIAEFMKSQPLAVRRRARALLKERWDCEAQEPRRRSPGTT